MPDNIADLTAAAERLRSVLKDLEAPRSGGPYYTQAAGEWVLELLTLVTKKGRVINVTGTAISTIRNKYYQGRRWLLENHPDKENIAKLCKLAKMTQTSCGIRVQPLSQPGVLAISLADDSWKEELLMFLQAPRGVRQQVFERTGLPWTRDDLNWARERCQEINPLWHTYIINSVEISILKEANTIATPQLNAAPSDDLV